jgi:purine-binding chemotaxis protein CheW
MMQQYCTFYVDELLVGIEVEKVQEVLRFPEMTPVPLAPGPVRGLINLRGQIVTAIDLRRRINLPPRENDNEAMNIILRNEGGTLSFLVDRVGDVIEVSESDFEEPPENLKGASRKLIRGAYKLKDRLMLVLDTENTLDISACQSQPSGGDRDQAAH